MSEAHSKFSASAAPRWLACPGSMALSKGLSDSTSVYAAWGSLAHDLADDAIQNGISKYDSTVFGTQWQDGHQIEIDQEMVDCVNAYLDHVAELTAGADLVQSETRTNYSAWLDVPFEAAWGTADLTAVWIEQRHMLVGDLKTGMGVEVDAENNEQGMLYAGGKLTEMDELGIEIDTIDIAISQPRIKSAPSVWRISADDLRAWLSGRARSGAVSVQAAEQMPQDDTWRKTFLRPGEKQCKFCRAKATCPALRDEVAQTVFDAQPATPDEFADLELPYKSYDSHEAAWLQAVMDRADMIEDFIKAVRAEVERRLLAGDNVPGYKLVQGKRGNRQWSNATEAEALLKSMRLKTEDMYDLKLISPTTAEKLAKSEVIGPRQWRKVAEMITQKEGSPHVAPLSDNRPALEVKPVADDFEPLSASTDDLC